MTQPQPGETAMAGLRGDAWQLLVDSASDAYVSIDAAGIVTRWNARAEELFGWPREQALDRLLAELIVPPEFRDAHLLGIQRFVATGRGAAVFQRLQLPASHRSGRRVDVEFTILPVEDPDAGWQFHAFLRDVTAELTHQRYVRLLQQVALTSNEATSAEAAVRDGVTAVQAATGSLLAHAYLVEDEPTIRLVPTVWWAPQPLEPLRSATAAGSFAVGEGLPGRVVATGEPAWIADISRDGNFPRADVARSSNIRAAFAFPVVAQKRVVAVLEFFRDHAGEPEEHLLEVMESVGAQLGRVFERERAIEDLRRVASDREAIVAIVGHELRGPLAAAHAAAGLLAVKVDQAEVDAGDLVVLLDRQLARLRRLVDGFLTAQRLEAGSLRVHARPNPLRGSVLQVVGDGDFDQVDVRVDDTLQVMADPDHLAQMLWNLLANAVRHGQPPVVVAAEAEGDAIRLSVSDAGPGVPADMRARLFERYARSTASQGAGLGLSIVRGLALANGGDVAYAHGPDAAAAFVLRLPSSGSAD